MCLIALAIGQSTRWPLVIASNRDEYFARPTLALNRWAAPSGAAIVSGRDLEAGGTWLGATPGGRVALLTNVREPGAVAGARSRGELPLAWLQGDQTAPSFLAALEPQAFSGFNLVIGDIPRGVWHWVSNRQAGVDGKVVPGWQHRELGAGVYGLSNAFLDTPWPKTIRLKQALRNAVQDTLDAEALWAALADARPASDDALPDTGISLEAERWLSSAWVRFPDGRYGTRASTLLAAQATSGGWTVTLEERTWLPGAGQTDLSRQVLEWPAPLALA